MGLFMARRSAQPAPGEDCEGQLLLDFSPRRPACGELVESISASPRLFELAMCVEFPQGADPELVDRLNRAGRRLKRGAVAGKWKLKKLATGLEQLAGLFDGVK